MKFRLLALCMSILWIGMGVWDGRAQDTVGATHKTTDKSSEIKLEKMGGSFRGANSIYMTSQPLIYVVESANHRFLVLNEQGKRIDSVGNQGFGNYQFDRPVDIDATNGLKIYVSDYNNGRIQVFDRRLQFLSSITPPVGNEQFYSYQPTELTISDNRELFFYEKDSGRLVQYNENGELLASMRVRTDRRLRSPADLDTYGGDVLLADSSRGVLHFLQPGGQYVKFVGRLQGICAISTSSQGIWALTPDRLVHLSGKGRFKNEYTWVNDIQPVDLEVNGTMAYILTRNSLWRTRIDK